MPRQASQIMQMNLVTCWLPALAPGVEPAEQAVTPRPPQATESILIRSETSALWTIGLGSKTAMSALAGVVVLGGADRGLAGRPDLHLRGRGPAGPGGTARGVDRADGSAQRAGTTCQCVLDGRHGPRLGAHEHAQRSAALEAHGACRQGDRRAE
jgi:hypothetical protein